MDKDFALDISEFYADLARGKIRLGHPGEAFRNAAMAARWAFLAHPEWREEEDVSMERRPS